MRLQKPRIAPMSDAEMGPEQKEALKDFGDGPLLNIFRTLARTPTTLWVALLVCFDVVFVTLALWTFEPLMTD